MDGASGLPLRDDTVASARLSGNPGDLQFPRTRTPQLNTTREESGLVGPLLGTTGHSPADRDALGSGAAVRVAVVQVGDVRVGMYVHIVFVAMRMTPDHRWPMGMGVVAVIVEMFVLMHERFMDVFMFVV